MDERTQVTRTALPRFEVSVLSTLPQFDGYGDENERRARRGRKIVGRYAEKHYHSAEDQNDVSMVASDLISDILHFAHSAGASPAALMERAGRSFKGDFEDEPLPLPASEVVVEVARSKPFVDAVVEDIERRRRDEMRDGDPRD